MMEKHNGKHSYHIIQIGTEVPFRYALFSVYPDVGYEEMRAWVFNQLGIVEGDPHVIIAGVPWPLYFSMQRYIRSIHLPELDEGKGDVESVTVFPDGRSGRVRLVVSGAAEPPCSEEFGWEIQDGDDYVSIDIQSTNGLTNIDIESAAAEAWLIQCQDDLASVLEANGYSI